MTKRVVAGILILAFFISFSAFSEWYLRNTLGRLSERAEQGDIEGFAQEYEREKNLLQFLVSDSSVEELELAFHKMMSEDAGERAGGEKETKEILFRLGEENLFSFVKIF